MTPAPRTPLPPDLNQATRILGQEALIGGALAAPQLPDQLAALPADTPPPADPVPGDVGLGDAPVQLAAAPPAMPSDLVSGAGASADLMAASNVLPPMISDAAIGSIWVTTLQPEFSVPSPLPTYSFGSPLNDAGIAFGTSSVAPPSAAIGLSRSMPQDHALIVPAKHAEPEPPAQPPAHAPEPAAPPAPAAAHPKAKPTDGAPQARQFDETGDNDVFIYGGSSGNFLMSSIYGPADLIDNITQAPDGSWVVTLGSQAYTASPGTHLTIGGYAFAFGENGSVSISAHNAILLAGSSNALSGAVTLSNAAAGSLGSATLAITSASALALTGAAGYSVAQHAAITLAQPDPHHHG